MRLRLNLPVSETHAERAGRRDWRLGPLRPVLLTLATPALSGPSPRPLPLDSPATSSARDAAGTTGR
jgi:hypothetical protein